MSNGITLGTAILELLFGAIGGGAVWYGLNWYHLRKEAMQIDTIQ